MISAYFRDSEDEAIKTRSDEDILKPWLSSEEDGAATHR
jgi:hypothetical protein